MIANPFKSTSEVCFSRYRSSKLALMGDGFSYAWYLGSPPPKPWFVFSFTKCLSDTRSFLKSTFRCFGLLARPLPKPWYERFGLEVALVGVLALVVLFCGFLFWMGEKPSESSKEDQSSTPEPIQRIQRGASVVGEMLKNAPAHAPQVTAAIVKLAENVGTAASVIVNSVPQLRTLAPEANNESDQSTTGPFVTTVNQNKQGIVHPRATVMPRVSPTPGRSRHSAFSGPYDRPKKSRIGQLGDTGMGILRALQKALMDDR
ncbi:hypothetical protein BJX70DRAFT_165998 [Aspergillus crustosus]